MRATTKPLGKATYVAAQLDWSWLQSVQRKLHKQSLENPEYVFCKLWGLVTDQRNLRAALERVSRNKGRRTAGVDGITVRKILADDAEQFIQSVRDELRNGSYKPSPVRRVRIPKLGQPGKFRPLGIPTVKDRVIQAALKNILEPIFEADFYPCSYGFRPGKSAHGALEHLRLLMRPTVRKTQTGIVRELPYQWAIEGDIEGCFDNIDHHGLMNRVRKRVGDNKVNRLIVAFLKAGVLSQDQFSESSKGTPQGGILSPLLANIALTVIEERYQRAVQSQRNTDAKQRDIALSRLRSKRAYDRKRRVVFFPIRYADDFVILVGAPPGEAQHERAEQAARQEMQDIAALLHTTLRLKLSEKKTLVTPVTEPLRFLGHHVQVRVHGMYKRIASMTSIPKCQSQHLRSRIKALFGRGTTQSSLKERLMLLNPLLRGWRNFYHHAAFARRVFAAIDNYVWHSILRWLYKKHGRTISIKVLKQRYVRRVPGFRSLWWHDGNVSLYRMARTKCCPFMLGWQKKPSFV
jgi:RNA-directed DNA polymerase